MRSGTYIAGHLADVRRQRIAIAWWFMGAPTCSTANIYDHLGLYLLTSRRLRQAADLRDTLT